MKLFGHRLESPTVVPNRTSSAMKDIAFLVRRIDSRLSDIDIVQQSAEMFKQIGFSEVLRPLSQYLDQEEMEIVQVYMSILINTMLHDPERVTVYLSVLVLIIGCFAEIYGSKPLLPLTIFEIESLTKMGREFIQESDSVKLGLLKKIVGIVRPSLRTVPLYIDASGFPSLRDNLKDAFAKSLSHGAETGRTVTVAEIGDTDVGLLHNDQVIFQLREQTSHNAEFRNACASIFQELDDIIPPPISSEPQQHLLDVLPSRQVRSLLKTGRITPQSRKKN